MQDFKTLIVGGGLSGLALADHLTQVGTDFLLIEAQDRLGGRIHGKTVEGQNFDLGPAWFWPGQSRIAALSRRFGLAVFEQYATGDLVFQDRSGAVQRGRGFASMQGSYRFAGGMTSLTDALARSVPSKRIMTGARLVAIETSRSGIVAEIVQDGTVRKIRAETIVLAVPPRVIAETVSFSPPIDPALIRSMAAVPTWMAGQAKILAVYDTPHWRNAGLSGDAMSQRGPMIELHDASAASGGPYAIFGFVGVPADARIAHQQDLLHLATEQLVDLFGPEMAHPKDLILQDWANVPEISRAQDRVPVRSHPDYGLPVEIRRMATQGIHFGSTETGQFFGGFLEGALEAAEMVAMDIATQVRQRA